MSCWFTCWFLGKVFCVVGFGEVVEIFGISRKIELYLFSVCNSTRFCVCVGVSESVCVCLFVFLSMCVCLCLCLTRWVSKCLSSVLHSLLVCLMVCVSVTLCLSFSCVCVFLSLSTASSVCFRAWNWQRYQRRVYPDSLQTSFCVVFRTFCVVLVYCKRYIWSPFAWCTPFVSNVRYFVTPKAVSDLLLLLKVSDIFLLSCLSLMEKYVISAFYSTRLCQCSY